MPPAMRLPEPCLQEATEVAEGRSLHELEHVEERVFAYLEQHHLSAQNL